MPNTKSAKKELRKSTKKALINAKVKRNLKELAKKSRKAILAKDKAATDLVIQTTKALDKAAGKKIIKKNTASRRKSRLQMKLNSMK